MGAGGGHTGVGVVPAFYRVTSARPGPGRRDGHSRSQRQVVTPRHVASESPPVGSRTHCLTGRSHRGIHTPGRFFHGRTLESLDEGCRFVINAANLMTGVRFAFEQDVLGDYVVGLAPTAGSAIGVATAVGASAAVPGAFAPLPVRGIQFPCPERGEPRLLDGGAYDNTGLEALDSDRYRDVFLVVMDAGGVFATGRWRGLPFIRNLMRANSLLYRESTGLRTRWMVDRFRAARDQAPGEKAPEWGRRGVLMSLASDVKTTAEVKSWRERFPEHRTWQGQDLAFVPTVFDRLDPRLCRLLVYRAWWLTGAMLARWYPGLPSQPGSAPPLD